MNAVIDALGFIDIQPNGELSLIIEPDDSAEVSVTAAQAHERHQRLQKSRVEMMRAFAEVHDCRREFLLNYFGESYTPPCANCEVGRIQEPEQSHPFPLNSRVAHSQWHEGDKITVLFDEEGYKTLALEVVLENGLLTPVA
jgi:ATP-dependent DNA helicase RecQ